MHHGWRFLDHVYSVPLRSFVQIACLTTLRSLSIVMGQIAILLDVVCEIPRFCICTSEFYACAISSLRGIPGMIRGGIYSLVSTIVRLSFINATKKPLYADALLTERLSSDQNVPSAFLLSTAMDPRSNRDASSIWSFAITLDLYLLAPPASRFFSSRIHSFIHSFRVLFPRAAEPRGNFPPCGSFLSTPYFPQIVLPVLSGVDIVCPG